MEMKIRIAVECCRDNGSASVKYSLSRRSDKEVNNLGGCS